MEPLGGIVAALWGGVGGDLSERSEWLKRAWREAPPERLTQAEDTLGSEAIAKQKERCGSRMLPSWAPFLRPPSNDALFVWTAILL